MAPSQGFKSSSRAGSAKILAMKARPSPPETFGRKGSARLVHSKNSGRKGPAQSILWGLRFTTLLPVFLIIIE